MKSACILPSSVYLEKDSKPQRITLTSGQSAAYKKEEMGYNLNKENEPKMKIYYKVDLKVINLYLEFMNKAIWSVHTSPVTLASRGDKS